MEKIISEVYYTDNNYCSYIPSLPGCVSTGRTLEEVERHMTEAVKEHVKLSIEDNDPIPDVFKDEFQLVFKLSAEALLNAYSNVFTKAALSRITGINERQLWHYAAGAKKPRPAQLKRIEEGLHKIGHQLIALEL
jgi:predicted RNase H-like HicB family nuclease